MNLSDLNVDNFKDPPTEVTEKFVPIHVIVCHKILSHVTNSISQVDLSI